MKFRVCYPKGEKKLMEEIVSNIKKDIDKRYNSSFRMKIKGWTMRRMKSPISDMKPVVIFEGEESEGILEINTGLDFIADKKRLEKELKEFEIISGGIITIDMIE